MVLRLNGNLSIDNLRNYPPAVVEELRGLLVQGGLAEADPRRDHFYELASDSRVFYIHVSPPGHKVLLLATWARGAAELERAAD